MGDRTPGGLFSAGRHPRSTPRFVARRRALTLLEVVIAISLIVVLLATMFAFYWQVIEIRKQAADMAKRTQLARQVLSGLESELRGCVGFDQIGFPLETPATTDQQDSVFTTGSQPPADGAASQPTDQAGGGGSAVPRLIGTRRSITFLTSALPDRGQYRFISADETPPPGQHDLRQVSYSLWVDPENQTEEGEPIIGGIIRTEKKTLNQFLVDQEEPLQIRNDLWSPELAFLEFRYFDGVEWDTKWDVTEGNSLPQLIQVTVGYKPVSTDELDDKDLDTYNLTEYPFGDDLYHPDRYSVIVKIPAADKFFSSRISRVGKQFTDLMGVGGGGLP